MDPAIVALLLAAIPAALGASNLFLLPRAAGAPGAGALVSILVPARDEEANIEACLRAALASRGVAVEAVVVDAEKEGRRAEETGDRRR